MSILSIEEDILFHNLPLSTILQETLVLKNAEFNNSFLLIFPNIQSKEIN